jgi:hypothetical protein
MINAKITDKKHIQTELTAEQLAALGAGAIAYIKPLRAAEIAQLFPQITGVHPDQKLFALLAANGSPIVLTDSKEAAIANAWEHELEMVSLHWSNHHRTDDQVNYQAQMAACGGFPRVFALVFQLAQAE